MRKEYIVALLVTALLAWICFKAQMGALAFGVICGGAFTMATVLSSGWFNIREVRRILNAKEEIATRKARIGNITWYPKDENRHGPFEAKVVDQSGKVVGTVNGKVTHWRKMDLETDPVVWSPEEKG